ncbi:MAG: multidrug effflux MFS transporter [Mariprofundus sp.]|nr:multidrug effflux MFS transporter [Mariprofundus sp.]
MHRRLTAIAALLAMLGPFTIDTYLPSFPDIENDFAVSRAILLQSLGIYLVAFAISTLFWGPLADRIGRRPVILISLSLYLIASAGCALATDIDRFLLLRMLQGLAASGGFIASRAMIRDAHDDRSAHQAMAQVMLLFAIAPAIAPILGGWLHDQFGWHSVFWFLSSFAMLLILLVIFTEETLISSHRQSFHPFAVIRVYLQTIKNSAFLQMVFTMAFSFAGLFLYIAGAPTVIYDFLELGSNDFSYQFIPMVVGMMTGAFISSRMVHYYSKQRIITLGMAIMTFAVFINLLQTLMLQVSIISVVAPLVIYALGLSMTMPALTVLALDCFPHHRGAAASMQGFLQMVICATVASVAVPLLHNEPIYFVLGQALFLIIALRLWLQLTPSCRTSMLNREHRET